MGIAENLFTLLELQTPVFLHLIFSCDSRVSMLLKILERDNSTVFLFFSLKENWRLGEVFRRFRTVARNNYILRHVSAPVRLSARISAAPTEKIFVKFAHWEDFRKICLLEGFS
jgi:hypothetical protein